MKKKKILMIEDELFELGDFIKGLEDDYEIIPARNGDIGLKILEERPMTIDIIILDIMLPPSRNILEPEGGYNMGLEVARQIRKRGINLPIIVYTGRWQAELINKLFEVGVTDVVMKNEVMTPESMKPIIRKHLR